MMFYPPLLGVLKGSVAVGDQGVSNLAMPLLTGKMEAVSLTDVISSPSPSAPASRFSRAKSPTTNEEISRTSYATAVDHALTPRYSARALDNQTQVYKTSKDYTQSRDLPNSLKWFYREKSELLVTRDVVGKLVATSTQKHNDTADKDYCFKLPADVSNYGGTNKVKGQIKTQQGTICYCPSPQNSLYSASVYAEARQSFTQTEVSERCSSSIEELTESTDASNCDDNLVESGKTSTGSDISGESSISAVSSAMYKPHMANDTRWESIRVIRCREGALGFNHFRLLTRLGKGDIGEVHLAELTGTKGYFAMKIMNKSELAGRKKLLRAQTEREILQCLDHPFLPTLYAHFETESSSCLVMEFCPGGDLHALRQRQTGKYFPEHAARFYVAEVLLALEYLHMLGIIYRDLKPENVLVREDGHIMLSDFDLSLRCTVSPTLVKSSNSNAEPKNSGYCVQPSCMQPSCLIQPACFSPRFLSNKPKKDKKRRQKHDIHLQVCPLPELMAEPTGARSMSFVGTHEYLAPEIIKGEGHGSAVDWWTFGIFLYELLFGRTPFKGHDNKATLFNIVGQPLRFPETPNVSFAARDLIRGLLAKEPQHRLAYRRGATEVKQHTFFQNVNWALIRCANPPDVPKPVTLDFLARSAEMNPIMEKNVADIDVQPCGNYLDIDFF